MRVGIDTNGLFTGQAGTARHIRGFLRGLANLPRSSDLDTFEMAWRVENFGYRQPARAFKTFYRELVWGRTAAPAELRRRHADLYHATGSYFVHPPRGVRVVVTLHDLAVLRNPERFRRWQRWSERKRLDRLHAVERIICISQFTADEAMNLLNLPAGKLEVVHSGCDFHSSEPLPAEEKPAFEVPPEFFLFVGSLEPGKNLSLLREAYALAAAEGKRLPPLLIVGARREGVVAEGDRSAEWSYLGRQPDGVLLHLYRRTLALVFPSKYEGFGLPVAEAMALGCPVICSRVASIAEAAGPAGCFAELTPASYLEVMRRVHQDSAYRAERIAAGREHVRKFSWTRFAQETVDIYQDVYRNG